MSFLSRLFNPAGRAAARELERRLEAFRAEIAAAREPAVATPEAFDPLRGRPTELGLSAEDVELELEWIDGLRDAAVLRQALDGGAALPVVPTSHRAVAGEVCHLLAAVSRPDVAGEQGGKLFITDRRLLYLGFSTLSVGWPHVVSVTSADRDLVVRARPDRLLRFRCNAYSDALCGVVIASQLLPHRPTPTSS